MEKARGEGSCSDLTVSEQAKKSVKSDRELPSIINIITFGARDENEFFGADGPLLI